METRLKILASTKTSQAVIVTDLISGVTTYLSARRAADALGISNSTVMNKLNNKNIKAYKGRYLIKGARA
jgi:DNA invertase Pin-like site-specific DNA recombinase